MGVKERKLREFKKRGEDILLAAYNLLINLEPSQMTMEMIAQKAEIGRGTIYKHFKSKDEIYIHLILKRREQYIIKLKNLLKEETNLLEKLINSYILYATEDKTAFYVHKKSMNSYIRSNIDKNLLNSLELQEIEKINLVKSIMEKAFKELNLESPNINYLIYAGWGMLRGAMNFMLETHINDENLDQNLFIDTVKQIFLSGIKN